MSNRVIRHILMLTMMMCADVCVYAALTPLATISRVCLMGSSFTIFVTWAMEYNALLQDDRGGR